MGTIVDKFNYSFEAKDLIKDSINNLGGSITSETELKEYAQELDNIYDNLPKTTGEDTNLSLTTLKGKMNIIPKGDTKQDGTPTPDTPIDIEVVTGTQEVKVENKNLLELKDTGTRTLVGITFSNDNENGTITANGTATANSIYILSNFMTLKAGTYTLSGCPNGNEDYRIDLIKDSPSGSVLMPYDVGSGATITLTEDTYLAARIRIKSDKTLNNVIFKPQLEYGSTATDFVVHQEQTQVVELSSKNFVTNTWQRTTTTSSSLYRIFSSTQLPITSGTYKVITNLDFTNYWYALEVGNTTYPFQSNLYDSGWKQENNIVHTILQNGYVGILVRKKNDTEINISDIQNFKFELVDNSEEYYNYELCKIGNYQDYLYKSNDKWYIKEQIGKVTLVANNVNTRGTTGTNAYYIATNIVGYNDNTKELSMSNMFQPCSFNDRVNGLDITYLQNGFVNIRTANNTTIDWSTLDKAKTWVTTNAPLLYYVLATPNDIEITNTNLIEQLDNLEKMYSYNGTTNISSSGNLPMILNISAIKGE